MQTRRKFLVTSGVVLGSLAISDVLQSVLPWNSGADWSRAADAAGLVKIFMKSDQTGAKVWFDPVGIYINPGQTVRWIVAQNVHTTTAYHPRNGNHSLRIPETAVPWDSGYLVNPGAHFQVTLKVEGVYDYYCIPHEMSGMVGRIIVGKPTGPGSLPFDYFKGKPGTDKWMPVPEEAQRAFPSIERIMREKIVRYD